MSNNQKTKIPTSFWIVAGLALVWNLLGVAAYISDLMISEDMLAQMTEAERAMRNSMPAWAKAAYALAVFGGALGGLALLLRRKIAFLLFALSLAGVLVQMFNAFILQHGIDVFGPGGMIMPAMIIVIGIALLWFSNMAGARGWLK